MRRIVIAVSLVALVGLVAICVPTPTVGAQGGTAASSPSTCETKHCSPNTHCCYGCSGSPICVKNGVPCPECAPQ